MFSRLPFALSRSTSSLPPLSNNISTADLAALKEQLAKLEKINNDLAVLPDRDDNLPEQQANLQREILHLQRTISNASPDLAPKEFSFIHSDMAKRGYCTGC